MRINITKAEAEALLDTSHSRDGFDEALQFMEEDERNKLYEAYKTAISKLRKIYNESKKPKP
jgi:hypothetical protein